MEREKHASEIEIEADGKERQGNLRLNFCLKGGALTDNAYERVNRVRTLDDSPNSVTETPGKRLKRVSRVRGAL